MRRRVGIVIRAFTALALAGTAGVTTFVRTNDDGRRVGTWHDAPGVARIPVALHRAMPDTGPAGVGGGRERIGTLHRADIRIGYGRMPTRHTFRHPGASYVKLHVSQVALGPGEYVTISDAAGRQTRRYEAAQLAAARPAGGAAPARPATGRWTMSVDGDTAVVHLHRSGHRPGRGGITVDRVARGYTARERAAAYRAAPAGPGREESVCGGDQSLDAACYRSSDPVAYTRSRAVARLLINGTELCSGWRIGKKNRMLTNNHCIGSSADAYQTEVWFNYQCAKCGGVELLQPTKVWGEAVLATNRVYDYTLFTVGRFDQVQKFGFLTIDTRRPNRGEELYIPQHPAGQPARIVGGRGEQAGTCAVVDRAYDGYAVDSDVSYYCDTEGGSSGSPVLSRTSDKVVALHHFGGCPNSGVRADVIYARLRNLL